MWVRLIADATQSRWALSLFHILVGEACLFQTPQLLLGHDNLCAFISKVRQIASFLLPDTMMPPHLMKGHGSSGDPVGVRLRACLHHSRPAAGGLSGPPEAHHVHVGGECGPLPACCQPHSSVP